MKIKLKTSFGGSINASFGDIIEIDAPQGNHLIAIDLAELVIEEEVKHEPEVKHQPKKKK